MSNPFISIIVPIYKVEQYLDRCIDSLLNQTMKDIEIILVNDGSPDNCPEMCDNYAERDKRIKVIHKVNGGLSDARNAGLQTAKGDYILFVDSDDYIENNVCTEFAKVVSNHEVDVIVGKAKKISGSHVTYLGTSSSMYGNKITGSNFLKSELKHNYIRMAVWLNLYSRKFLISNNLYFKFGLLHEDEEWTPRVFLVAQEVFVTDICFYNYIDREDSICKTKDFSKNAKHIISTVVELHKLYSKLCDEELKVLLNDYLVSLYLFAYQKGNIHMEPYGDELIKEFIKENASSLRNKIKAMIFCMNPKLYCLLVRLR